MVVLDFGNIWSESIIVKIALGHRNIESGLDFDVLFPNRAAKSKTTNVSHP